MSLPRFQQPEPAHGIAALIGEVLGALLCAWLRWLRRRAMAVPGEELEGALTSVLVSQAGIALEYEPWVEWEAVPAPWRNGQLLPRRHECGFGRGPSLGAACRGAALWEGGRARGQGPPIGRIMPGVG